MSDVLVGSEKKKKKKKPYSKVFVGCIYEGTPSIHHLVRQKRRQISHQLSSDIAANWCEEHCRLEQPL